MQWNFTRGSPCWILLRHYEGPDVQREPLVINTTLVRLRQMIIIIFEARCLACDSRKKRIIQCTIAVVVYQWNEATTETAAAKQFRSFDTIIWTSTILNAEFHRHINFSIFTAWYSLCDVYCFIIVRKHLRAQRLSTLDNNNLLIDSSVTKMKKRKIWIKRKFRALSNTKLVREKFTSWRHTTHHTYEEWVVRDREEFAPTSGIFYPD